MGKLEALKALAEKVAAGDKHYHPSRDFHAAMGGKPYDVPNGPSLDASRAYHGSLDAAKALHEAVLHERVFVEIEWSKRYEEESRVTLNMGKDGWISASDNPARAWLLAILKALIAQEEAA